MQILLQYNIDVFIWRERERESNPSSCAKKKDSLSGVWLSVCFECGSCRFDLVLT